MPQSPQKKQKFTTRTRSLEIDELGNEIEQKVLTFYREQDGGNPHRWYERYCRIEIVRYVNHCHGQQVKRNPIEAMQEIASSLFMIMIAGIPKELCPRSHLADYDDDF
ncbi:hypothetical protein [Microseira wollei]|uniref:Transposase n=1 Tax=Microseira wollei NIES-4236 TaxID=2530354 RepID=A0AAV3XJB2_9CYAN|nr:hypothetical protein [Microseira wollei]GET43007.1 hypothetical protein MiSe_78270 [Microseira wollei NIES-4236]